MISLKALELFGFKSFADRTRFDFPAGVTAVVGPNGSGKSNVVDAIKWVLGEQSARSLRGKEMTDVIFAGSTARKPLNMAEVSLVFDNGSRALPLDTDEVRIMRRVYRSGESEYLVNGEVGRLKDIRELFSGTGAATEAYSVIEQGRVDALLVASGRDRRVVFEEAAGITRFRTRRTEALRRLERAELNRQRLADIVGEVSGRLETVRNQAARAHRWRTMTHHLRTLRVAAATQDLSGVDARVAAVEAALAADHGALTVQETRAATATAELARLGDAAAAVQPRLAALRAEAGAASQREAATVATLESQRVRQDELEAERNRGAERVARAIRDARAAAGEVSATELAARHAAEALAALDERVTDSRRTAAGSHEDAAAAREALARATAARGDMRERLLRLEAAVEMAAGRLAEAAAAVDEARDALATTGDQRAALDEARSASEGHLQSLQSRLANAALAVEAADAAHRAGTERLQEAWQRLADARAAALACRERRDVLHEMVDRQEGLSDAARRLLHEHASVVPGLAGVVADQVRAGVDWAEVVDLALGRRGQGLLVESLDDVIRWHADWSAGEAGRGVLAAGGRIGFLAALSLPEPAAYDPADCPGVVGRLDRLLGDAAGGPGGSDINDRLLAHAWIVERIADALPLLAEAPAGTLFMTRGGECLSSAEGLEIGGVGSSHGLVSRRSELRAAEQRAAELVAVVDEATTAVTAHEAELARLREAVTSVRGRRQEAADAITAARAELGRIQRDQRSADTAITAAEARLREAERRAVATETASRTARTEMEGIALGAKAADAEEQRCRAAIDALERSRGEVIEEVHRLQVERATGGEKLDRLWDAARAAVVAAAARGEEIEAAHAASLAIADRLRTWELDLLAATARHADAAWDAQRAATSLADVERMAAADEAARQRAERARDEARDEAAAISERIHAHDLEAGEARHQRARIVERIRDEYDLDIDAVTAASSTGEPTATEPASETEPASGTEPAEPIPADRAELELVIEQLRRKIAAMGNVNLEALAEAEELAGRLATLEAQLADVTAARESIEELISRIDEESRRLLGETIETVRGHFRELFERVFGGGQADIVLEPGVDLLETAVEIVARPPGKEPRSISLLSGGEKTMTCVALLLAIFRSRPSPFCVLDEVDAALDEANVDRFVGVLRDFLSATQFIVVTHSKKTMAAAGTLYGVTMEESGVSKRISVRFEATAATAVTSRAA
jgi:chromosome segregation protein